jgi:hypothetical protein
MTKLEGHIMKFSGLDYKSKEGAGDELKKGKYEPFAYIQLNPRVSIVTLNLRC